MRRVSTQPTPAPRRAPRAGDQSADREFETPTKEQIVAISAKHVEMMESSDADDTWIWAGMQHVLLRTVGRKSGNVHKVALPFWRDASGQRIIAASFGGNPTDPAWFLNLSDRSANPDVAVKVQGASYRCVPQILEGEEYDEVWAGLVADRPWYADYVVKAGGRKIPLVRLPER